nr:PfkB family carbohydrate kinase [Iodidimonas gelatinilytica]
MAQPVGGTQVDGCGGGDCHRRFVGKRYCLFFRHYLAILSPPDREALFAFLQNAKEKGALIAFDPNYRPALWESRDCAAANTMAAYGLSDMVLTGEEEEANLFGWRSQDTEISELERIGVAETIVKAGERGIFGKVRGGQFHVPFEPADRVVDTTAAGDSFAGAYLAYRLKGQEPEQAVESAARIARIVVSSPGAIIERERFFAQLRSDNVLAPEHSNVT